MSLVPAIWYPTHVDLHGKASTVQWRDLAGVPFNAPFFQHTVALAQDRSSKLTLLGEATPEACGPSSEPAAFIFHVSRCGSTLLCNLLRARHNIHVVAEPQPVVALLAPFSQERWPYAADEWEHERDQLLRQMVCSLGKAPLGGQARYVIKLTSYSAMRMEVIRKLWPQTPIIFLVRDPVDVMLSNMNRPAAWMRIRQRPQQARAMFEWTEDSSTMTREEFCARVFGQLCQSAMRHRGTPSLVLDYRELLNGGWTRVSSLLGLGAPDASEQDRIEQALRNDAKRGGELARIEDSARDPANAATAEMHAAARRWALPELASLLES